MRTLTSFFFLAACAAPPSRPTTAPDRDREIPICVVNDENAPVPEEIVLGALHQVSEEYGAHVGIVFIPIRRISARFDPSGWPMDTAFFLRSVCPESAEVRFVFTNRFVAPKEVSMTVRGDGGQMAGDAHPYYGFVIAYSAEERWNARNAAGDRALIGTLKHEIGHLFGLDDEKEDRTSFMYFASNGSLGRWTPKTLDRIHHEKWRRWWPHP